MGYGYAQTFLIVFLTHPGVILPTTTSLSNLVSSRVPGPVADILPTGGTPPTLSGLWQLMWFWILSLPGTRGAGFAWTMYIVYIVFLFLYMYFFIGTRMSTGI